MRETSKAKLVFLMPVVFYGRLACFNCLRFSSIARISYSSSNYGNQGLSLITDTMENSTSLFLFLGDLCLPNRKRGGKALFEGEINKFEFSFRREC